MSHRWLLKGVTEEMARREKIYFALQIGTCFTAGATVWAVPLRENNAYLPTNRIRTWNHAGVQCSLFELTFDYVFVSLLVSWTAKESRHRLQPGFYIRLTQQGRRPRGSCM